MGLTLVAILTAALLLPGIVAARVYYLAGQTREIEVPVPPLSTPEGLTLIGTFSVLAHMVYVFVLKLVELLPPWIPLPPANPYLLFVGPLSEPPLDAAYALFGGLTLLCLLAAGTGFVSGKIAIRFWHSSFYGPLNDVLQSAAGADKVIVAYVVSKIEVGEKLVGYRGTVDSLFRDADRFPSKVVLKDVVPFYLKMEEGGPKRQETDQLIDWMALSASDWHNIAFKVFQYVDESDVAGEQSELGAGTIE